MKPSIEVDYQYDDFDFLPLSVCKEVLFAIHTQNIFEAGSNLVKVSEENNISLNLIAGQFVAWNMEKTAYDIFCDLKLFPRDLLRDINEISMGELYFSVFLATDRHEVAYSVARKTLEMYVRAMESLGPFERLTDDAKYIIDYRMHIIRTQGYKHLQNQKFSVFSKN